MTGDDSPTPNRKEEFSFGRSTPPPTTSYYPKQEHADIKTVAEPNKEDKDKEKEKDKEKDKDKDDKDDVDILRPDANPGYKPEEKKDTDDRKDDGKRDKDHGKDGKSDKESSDKKCNGDRLDGQWIPARDTKTPPSDDEDDSNCTVKCLYYTMQCCECSIS